MAKKKSKSKAKPQKNLGGRPPKDPAERRGEMLHIRATKDELQKISAAATACDETTSDWARGTLIAAADKILAPLVE